MKDGKTVYHSKNDDQINAEIDESVELFLRLSPDMQDTIIDWIKSLLSAK